MLTLLTNSAVKPFVQTRLSLERAACISPYTVAPPESLQKYIDLNTHETLTYSSNTIIHDDSITRFHYIYNTLGGQNISKERTFPFQMSPYIHIVTVQKKKMYNMTKNRRKKKETSS